MDAVDGKVDSAARPWACRTLRPAGMGAVEPPRGSTRTWDSSHLSKAERHLKRSLENILRTEYPVSEQANKRFLICYRFLLRSTVVIALSAAGDTMTLLFSTTPPDMRPFKDVIVIIRGASTEPKFIAPVRRSKLI